MHEFNFLLTGKDLPSASRAPRSPGFARTCMELAASGPLGRSFDNNCAHRPAEPVRVVDNRSGASDALPESAPC